MVKLPGHDSERPLDVQETIIEKKKKHLDQLTLKIKHNFKFRLSIEGNVTDWHFPGKNMQYNIKQLTIISKY